MTVAPEPRGPSRARRRLSTVRGLLHDGHALSHFISGRFPALGASAWARELCYAANWRDIFPFGLRSGRRHAGHGQAHRYLVREPNTAGIGDQIVTSWSEAYVLAEHLGLSFVHAPFAASALAEGVDWDRFLGFGVGELQLADVLDRGSLRMVCVPPRQLTVGRAMRRLERLVHCIYPERDTLFHLGRAVYLNSPLDQGARMPAVYRAKYEAARMLDPMPLGWRRDRIHIGLHVRRGADIAPLVRANTWEGQLRWLPSSYYRRILNALAPHLAGRAVVHIFTDGTAEDVRDLHVFPDTEPHVDQDARVTFHQMTQCDVFITGTSAFALVAAKIGRGVKLISRSWDRPDFRLYLPTTADWIDLDSTTDVAAAVHRALHRSPPLPD